MDKAKRFFRSMAMLLAVLMLVTSLPIETIYSYSAEVTEAVEEESFFEEETVSGDSVSENSEEDEEERKEESVSENSLEAADIAKGSYKNTTWRIDSTGKLIVQGTGNAYSDEKEYGWCTPPWNEYCDQIKSAKVKLKGVTTLNSFFADCYNMKSVDLSELDTSEVTDMSRMFAGCGFDGAGLKTLDLRNFNTSKVTDMSNMFQYATDLQSVDLSSFDTRNVTDMSGMFNMDEEKMGNEVMKTLDVSSFNTSKVTNMSHMFSRLEAIESLDLSNFDTSNVTDMGSMFYECRSLKRLNISSFNTSKVTIMGSMFCDCEKLTSLDLRHFNTENVGNGDMIHSDMSYMFSGCKSLSSLDVSSFNTSKVTQMGSMFRGCSSLARLDLSSFDTSNVFDMGFMFDGCSNLRILDLSGFKVNKLKTSTLMQYFIYYSGMGYMFRGCSSLTSLDLSGFDLASLTDEGNTTLMQYFKGVFEGCDSLNTIKTPQNVNINIDLPGSGWKRFDTGKSITALPKGLNRSAIVYSGEAPELTGDTEQRINIVPVSPLNNEMDVDYAQGGAVHLTISFRTDSPIKQINAESGQFKIIDTSNDNVIYESKYSSAFKISKDGSGSKVSFTFMYGGMERSREYSIVIDEGFLTFEKANEYAYVKMGQWKFSTIGSKEVTIKLGFGGEKKISFDPKVFAQTSNSYNPELSNLAICLSTSVYETDGADEDKEHERMGYNFLRMDFNKGENVREFVEKHYFPDDTGHSTNQADQGDNSPFWIADKKIHLGEEDYNLIMVVIRGTYDTEWIDNFDSGTGDTHMGFERAAVNVVDNLNNYIGMNDIKGNIKILITGHSRGAAVANLVGKKLDDGEVSKLSSINRNDVFVYTYATPNVTSKSNRSNSKYNNIFNILNPEDFVTKVLPTGWGYGRYGINYVLPSSTFYPKGFDKYNSYHTFVDAVSEKVKKYRPNAKEYYEYNPYDLGMLSVMGYVDGIMLFVPNIRMYYSKPLGIDIKDFINVPYTKTKEFTVYTSLYSLFRHFLAYNRTRNYAAQSYVTLAQAINGTWGTVGRATSEFFAYNGKFTPQFGCAHTPETYMAMLELTPPEILKVPKYFFKVVVNCPVDVTVKDGNGNIIGKTVQDTVQSTTNELALSVEGESKTLLIPEGADYTLELTGNDTGTMDYSIVKYDADTGEVGRDIYLDLPLTKGTKYSQDLEGYNDAGDAPLLDGNSNAVEKTLSLKGDELGALSVKVNVEGDGSALGYENVTPGDYVTLQAYTNEFNEFLGWYDANGNLITKDAEYGFSIQKNEEFTAKFTSNDDGLWVESIAPVKYSGSVQKPNVNVYDGYTELIEKKDYTLTYKNNKEVYTLSENDPGFDPKKAPNVTITGKGNYSSKEVVYFKILPQDIGGYEFSADDITMSYTGKKQKIKPLLYWNSKTLANGKEYRFDIYRASDVEFKQPLGDTIIEEGDYVIRYAGKGNFIGTRNCTLSIRKDIKLVNKLKIGKISNQKYTGKVIRPEPEVKDGNVLLEKDKHYTLSYASNENIGTGYVIVSGIPENGYSGSKRISFKITGTKATSYDISTAKDTEKRITVVCDKNTPFKKGGAKPSVVVTFKDTDGSVSTLVEQKDYKLSYKNNTTFNTKNAPAVIITGMGRFKGKREETFAIRETGLNTSILIADDKPFNTKPNKYTTKVTLVDEDGKNLSAGKDYDKNLNYTYLKDTKVTVNGSEVNRLAGSSVEKTDVIPVDTVIKVTAVAKAGSGYTGTVSGTYKIMTASIASAKVTVPAQTYTGKPIILAKDKITVSIKGQKLNANDYEIVGYVNNVAKGTAKVTIRGIGNYGGLKTQSFTIKAKGLTWWKKLKKALAN